MSEVADDLFRRLYNGSPFQGFSAHEWPLDLQGGKEHRLLSEVIERVRPRVVIEVGCWKGANAIRMAQQLSRLGIDGAVICVDTWLGSVDNWANTISGWDIRPTLKYGYPVLYYQFLANVLHSGTSDRIVPLPNTSDNAARLLRHHGVLADLIYIDASHEEEDVYRDVCSYWKLLRPGGVLCGDDWDAYWYGVICGVNRFASQQDLKIQSSGQMWLLSKPNVRHA